MISCFFILHLQAQSFTAQVDKASIPLNSQIQLSFIISDINNPKEFRPPSFTGFDAFGPSQSTQISSYNGNTSRTTTYSYVLRPKDIGTFSISPASIVAEGKTYTTKPITITITERTKTQSNQSGNQNSSDASQDINAYIKDNLFLRTEVSSDKIYRGESITVTQKLYRKRNSSIVDFRITGANLVPKYNGFYAEDVNVENQQASLETINGEQYIVQVLKKTILTAQQSGTLEADALNVDAVVAVKTKSQKKSRDPFEDIFGDFFEDPFNSSYERTQLTLSSPVVKIQVLDLPPNAPADFNGAVGSFTMKTELSSTATKTDEPLTYRVIISGTGNLKLFDAPQLNLPAGWETYDPKITETANSKTYEYLLIPRSPGDFEIPAHTWTYFHPDKKQYITLNSEKYSVHVEAGPNYQNSSSQATNKEDVELLAKDIRYLDKNKPRIQSEAATMNSLLFYGGCGLPLLAGIFIFFLSNKKNKQAADLVAQKNKKATAVAKKRLTLAKSFIQKNDQKAFYNEVIRALWGYYSDKFNIQQSVLSKENIQSYLNSHQISETLSQKIFALLDTCEMALFAPTMMQGGMKEVYEQAIDVISKSEEEIK